MQNRRFDSELNRELSTRRTHPQSIPTTKAETVEEFQVRGGKIEDLSKKEVK